MRSSRLVLALLVLASIASVVPWGLASRSGGRPTLLFTIWGMPFEDVLFKDRYADEYQRLRPEVRVDYRRYGPDLIVKYNAWHALGRGADVMRLRVTEYHGMIARGMLEPLGRYIRSDDPAVALAEDDWLDIPEHLRRIAEVHGEVYAIPQDNAQYGLFFNRALFARHNAERPHEPVGEPGPHWAWDDLRRAARLLTRRDGAGRLVQAGIDFQVWSWPFLNFFAQAGGELWSPDGLTCMINSPAGVETLEFFRALIVEDRSCEPSLGRDTGVGPEARFVTGQTAMYLDGSWRVPNFEILAPGLDFAVRPLPRGKRAAVVSGCVLWGISVNAAHKDEAWRMIRWLAAREQAAAYWDTLRVAPPARTSVLQSESFRSTRGVLKPGSADAYEVPPMPPERFPDRAAWLLHGNTPDPETGRAPAFVPVHEHQTELEAIIQRMLEEYLRNPSREPPRAALDRAVREIHGVIDRDRQAKGLPAIVR